jgi:hypothetical protein
MARFYGYETQGSVTYDKYNRLNTMCPRKTLINEAQSLTERICLAGMGRQISPQTKCAHLRTKETVTVYASVKIQREYSNLVEHNGVPIGKNLPTFRNNFLSLLGLQRGKRTDAQKFAET